MVKAMKGVFTFTGALLAVVILAGAYVNVTSPKPYVQRSGEALIRYTGLSGWIIETRHHVIIIDYVELQPPRVDRTISNGYIDPEYLDGRSVRVFVTHGHGDHYWPPIRDWSQTVRDIRYFFGWGLNVEIDAVRFTGYRMNYTEPGLSVHIVNHPVASPPEVAYLIEVDGITLYHTGDLSTSVPELDPRYKSNIDYVAGLTGDLDLLFVSMFGGYIGKHVNPQDVYTINTLKPFAVFPQHYDPGVMYRLFAEEAQAEGAQAVYCLAERRGDAWLYSGGVVIKLGP
jgi:L-ascorbate metabolism protein UlaG (beta-lactamase superfamily)